MAQLNGLPVFYIKIKEDLSSNTGIDFISLVDCPAIESNWVAMADNKAPLKFSTDEDKQLLYGPILIPDLPIYRFDKDMGEYYVVFTAEEIQKLVRKFQASQKSININYQHQKNSQLKAAVVQEIWLTGKIDKSQTLGFDLPVNSAFVCSHIGDKEFWMSEVKTGNVRGYSIEGFLDMEMKKIKKNQNMSAEKFVSAKTDKGIDIKTDADAFVNGVDVYTETDGNKTPCATGDYVLENGTTLKVVDGKITEVVEMTEEMSPEAVEVIQKAVQPLLDAFKTQVDAYELRIKELETKLSNMPGAKSATEKTDKTELKKLTPKQEVLKRFQILNKKSQEITK